MTTPESSALADLSVNEFLNRIASREPVPGGGSVSALAGALAASLSAMVAGLTIGRKGFEFVSDEMTTLAADAKILLTRLAAAIDRDAAAYAAVMAAFKLPKTTDDEKSARTEAIQKAMIHAAEVPLAVAGDALAVMDLAAVVVEKGNPNAVTDGAVAAMMARTAVLGAVYNVRINLASIHDGGLAADLGVRADALAARARDRETRILAGVKI